MLTEVIKVWWHCEWCGTVNRANMKSSKLTTNCKDCGVITNAIHNREMRDFSCKPEKRHSWAGSSEFRKKFIESVATAINKRFGV